jgi:hypothetical protein
MRLPRILSHAFDSDSKTATFGWALKILATALYLLRPDFGAERWERVILIAAILVGGKLVKELLNDQAEIKAAAPAKAPGAA